MLLARTACRSAIKECGVGMLVMRRRCRRSRRCFAIGKHRRCVSANMCGANTCLRQHTAGYLAIVRWPGTEEERRLGLQASGRETPPQRPRTITVGTSPAIFIRPGIHLQLQPLLASPMCRESKRSIQPFEKETGKVSWHSPATGGRDHHR